MDWIKSQRLLPEFNYRENDHHVLMQVAGLGKYLSVSGRYVKE